ncbi:MAG TPA: hypothetical protein PK798_04045 [Flavobacteriales bacterium]|nr:hypothetical protein [Flavobacteriales bacterium]HRJ35864.1 hypothetical protein [Flavobacteriales bacterium]HRJ37935.1 hypothetical protein [Flavobacteriales bacterium]
MKSITSSLLNGNTTDDDGFCSCSWSKDGNGRSTGETEMSGFALFDTMDS